MNIDGIPVTENDTDIDALMDEVPCELLGSKAKQMVVTQS